MTADPRRLRRLARAQADLADLLEHRFESEARKGTELAHVKSGTFSALERISTSGLVFYAAALRRLAEVDAAIAMSEQVRRDLARKLLQARRRQETLMRRALEQQQTQDRKVVTEEAREVALAMADKATGKPHVMK